MRDRTLPGLLALIFVVGLTALGLTMLGSPQIAARGPVPAVDSPAPPEVVEVTIEEPFRLEPLAPKAAPFPRYEAAGGARELVPLAAIPTSLG